MSLNFLCIHQIYVCVHVFNFFLWTHNFASIVFSFIILDILHGKVHVEYFFVVVNCLVIHYMNVYLIGELPVFSPAPLSLLPPSPLPPSSFLLLQSPSICCSLTCVHCSFGMCKENSFSLAELSGTYSLPFPHPDCCNSHT